MSEAELAAFVADVRAQGGDALARVDTVDRDALEPALRDEYDRVRRQWEALRALVSDEDVIAMHLEACERAGRELTPDEMLALLGLIPQPQSVRI